MALASGGGGGRGQGAGGLRAETPIMACSSECSVVGPAVLPGALQQSRVKTTDVRGKHSA